MNKNMGTLDRVIRIVIAAVIAYLYFTNKIEGTLGIILLIVAAVFLLTSLLRICPLYFPLGLKTFREKK